MLNKVLFGTVIFVLSFLLTYTPAFADNNPYKDITSNTTLVNTLNVLKNHNALTNRTLNIILGDNLSKKPMIVMFYDFSAMGGSYEKMDAVACKKRGSDRIYILINNIHQNAPVEALASILTHETIHQDDISSIEEETIGWTNEAKTWISYKQTNKKLNNADCALVTRLNTLSEMYRAANNTSEKIERTVSSTEGYSLLAKYSPGYGM